MGIPSLFIPAINPPQALRRASDHPALFPERLALRTPGALASYFGARAKLQRAKRLPDGAPSSYIWASQRAASGSRRRGTPTAGARDFASC